jgi:hypothetical protein
MATWSSAMARTLAKLGAALLLSGTLLGCGINSTVSFVLEFPSEGAFLASTAAKVSVYDAEANIEICRSLIAGDAPGQDPLAELPSTDVCQFHNHELTLGDLSQGVRALYVEVTGKGDKPIMVGCRIFDLTYSRDPVQVDLSVTEDFAANAATPTANTAQSRCGQ